MVERREQPESIDDAVDHAVVAFTAMAGRRASAEEATSQAQGFNQLHNLIGPTRATRIVSRVRGPNWTAVITFRGIRVDVDAPLEGAAVPTDAVRGDALAVVPEADAREPMPWPAGVRWDGAVQEYLRQLHIYAAGVADNPEDTTSADFIERVVRNRNAEFRLVPPANWRDFRPEATYRGPGWRLTIVGPYAIFERVAA